MNNAYTNFWCFNIHKCRYPSTHITVILKFLAFFGFQCECKQRYNCSNSKTGSNEAYGCALFCGLAITWSKHILWSVLFCPLSNLFWQNLKQFSLPIEMKWHGKLFCQKVSLEKWKISQLFTDHTSGIVFQFICCLPTERTMQKWTSDMLLKGQ